MHSIYLDYNRTTPLAPSVREAMEPFWSQYFMLPSQSHRGCQAVADAVDRAREQIAGLMGCESYEVVFTSGGTESNNLAIFGLTSRMDPGHILVSPLEHDSVWWTVDALRETGWTVDVLRPNHHGLVAVQEVENQLQSDTRVVCLQAANPVLGTLQPVREVADLCHGKGILLHCDAVQLFGKVETQVGELRADTVSLSGHKMYGPKGVGALYVRRGLDLAPRFFGESNEMGLRPGSEDVASWIGLGAAARLAESTVSEASDQLEQLRDLFVSRLQSQVGDDLLVACGNIPRLPNTALLQLPKEASRVIKTARQIAIPTSRSATPADEMTRCLSSIGFTPQEVLQCCRVSVGINTSREDCERAADLLAEAIDIV